MNIKTDFLTSALMAMAVLSSFSANAGGFQIDAFSAAGLGRAFSGEGALADSPASASKNPATLMMFARPAIAFGVLGAIGNTSISGDAPAGSNIAGSRGWVPNLHYVYPIDRRFAIGGSVTSNYGWSSELNDSRKKGKTAVATMNINLSGAYRLSRHFSFGLGIDAVYAKGKAETYAGRGSDKLGIPDNALLGSISDAPWGYGWNAGILYEVNESNRFGLTYRSEVNLDFNGEYKSDIPSRLNLEQASTGLLWGTDGYPIHGSLPISLPETWELSGYHKVAPLWAVHYSLAYTSWSRFPELKATGRDGQALFKRPERFQDAYRLALGATYFYNDHWSFRTGIAFDESPVPARYNSVYTPSQNRIYLSAGTRYAFDKRSSVDLGVSYARGQSAMIEDGASAFRITTQAWLFGTNLNYDF
ncbi:TPA: outer membrane protein transport protein [Serratia marcescens]|uniref:outer membrane protein transport protein n=1 Tax=Serratia ureilytica TaxID=300181 RepID=UPI0018D85B9E|nr:outer membrane protein transport protein [Serratia ureilytica]MBH3319150.1 outer membrane protein transport protein [Serratia ureilytica]